MLYIYGSYVKLEQSDKATEILARRKDVYCLELASELAFLNGDEGYGMSLIIEAVKRALVKLNWSKARELIKNFRQLQVCVYNRCVPQINGINANEIFFFFFCSI